MMYCLNFIDYPQHLHDEHADYPLAPESTIVTTDMLSQKQLDMLGVESKEDIKASKIKKLIPNLNNKRNYIVHYRNLQLYIALGMQLTKIHRVLSFHQSPWLKTYIDFNTDMRARANNDFEKSFFKLMNNAMFGKTMENLRKRVNIDLITTEEQLRKRVIQPSFKGFKIFHENLISVERRKTFIKLNRPIYIGFAVLDLSKYLMFSFHYGHIKELYPGKMSQLLFTDTDSLTYKIETDDIYQDMLQHQDLYDFSGYPKEHKCYSNVNKKVIGKFKDEINGEPLVEFVGLKAKMYSLKHFNRGKIVETRKAKGVKKCVVKKRVSHDDYKDCLFKNSTIYRSSTSIRSIGHQLYTLKQNKKSLSAFDDKRYILDDGISTLPHGHKITL